eukprot:1578424-Rhodomonas_salina.2
MVQYCHSLCCYELTVLPQRIALRVHGTELLYGATSSYLLPTLAQYQDLVAAYASSVPPSSDQGCLVE